MCNPIVRSLLMISPRVQVWENLHALADVTPVVGNYQGQYLTMLSKVRTFFRLAGSQTFFCPDRVPSLLLLDISGIYCIACHCKAAAESHR